LNWKKKKPNEWIILHKNPGTAVVHIKKRRPGYSEDHPTKNHHRCKGATITVKAKKPSMKKSERMAPMTLEHGDSKMISASKVYLDPNSPKGIVSIHKTAHNQWKIKAHHKSGSVMIMTKQNDNDEPTTQQYRIVKAQ